MRQALAGLLALAVAALTAFALGGNSRLDGPVILRLTTDHGLHRGDVLPLTLGAVILVGLVALARTPSRSVRSRASGRRVGAGQR